MGAPQRVQRWAAPRSATSVTDALDAGLKAQPPLVGPPGAAHDHEGVRFDQVDLENVHVHEASVLDSRWKTACSSRLSMAFSE